MNKKREAISEDLRKVGSGLVVTGVLAVMFKENTDQAAAGFSVLGGVLLLYTWTFINRQQRREKVIWVLQY